MFLRAPPLQLWSVGGAALATCARPRRRTVLQACKGFKGPELKEPKEKLDAARAPIKQQCKSLLDRRTAGK